eukprot:GHRQ01035261.1.p1 GENE.GHRQ01035261.1~~GHRQ01035261.1.p1  ORF type:complete len:196 (+),score=79.74 GHRQ01035261.1:1111-1698(+)
MSYCIVRPGGMERPTDDYKNTHNLTLKPRDSTFGGQVSRLQVAELVTAALVNPELAANKCLELVAETSAPAASLAELLDSLPTEITKEEQEQLAEVEAEARAELAAAQAALREAQEAVAISADKLAELNDALKEAKVRGHGRLVSAKAAQLPDALKAPKVLVACMMRDFCFLAVLLCCLLQGRLGRASCIVASCI